MEIFRVDIVITLYIYNICSNFLINVSQIAVVLYCIVNSVTGSHVLYISFYNDIGLHKTKNN